MARFRRQTETVNGRQLIVIGDPVKFADCGIDFTPDAVVQGTPYTETVSGFTRRRFPGGPAASVSGHSRSGTRGGDLAGTNAEAGRPFYIEEVRSAPGVTPREVKTWVFAYVGRWRDLKTKIIADLAPSPNRTLRNASGSSKSLATGPVGP